ncbi:MAG TPA: hypothetical protein VFD13_02205 [Candidatus Kapabacteria bacterium]|nr:hypothetical protein [Candidatus Kapabacteria bacterium]
MPNEKGRDEAPGSDYGRRLFHNRANLGHRSHVTYPSDRTDGN